MALRASSSHSYRRPRSRGQVVEAIKFAPLGNRGFDGAGLDGDYGLEVWRPDATYFEDANRETFFVAQIETPQALENLDAIAAVPGLDLLVHRSRRPGDAALAAETAAR